MQFIFGAILLLIWFFFWIRRNIWAAIVGAAPPVILILLAFISAWQTSWNHITDLPSRMFDTWVWFAALVWIIVAFLPWYIDRHRKSNIEKALHKVKQSMPGDDPGRLFADIYVEGYMSGFAAAEGEGAPPVPSALVVPQPQCRLPRKLEKPHVEGKGKIIAYWVCVWLFVLVIAVQIVNGIVTGTEYPPIWFIVACCAVVLFFSIRYIIKRRRRK